MRKQPPSIWVTRSAPYNLLAAQRLRAMGSHVITVPLLDVRQLPCEKALARPNMLAFTSVHGVRHHPFDSEWADVPVLAVGDTTAAAVRRSGYLEVRSAGGAVADLQTLALRSATSGSRVIHFGALEPAGDFAGYLSRRGFDAMHVPVYETEPCVEGADLLLAGNSGVNGVLVHSPKAGRLLASLIERTRCKGTVVCLSEACAAELRHIPSISVSIARRPTERSLLRSLADCFNIPRRPLADTLSPRHQAVFGTSGGSVACSANDNLPPSPPPA